MKALVIVPKDKLNPDNVIYELFQTFGTRTFSRYQDYPILEIKKHLDNTDLDIIKEKFINVFIFVLNMDENKILQYIPV